MVKLIKDSMKDIIEYTWDVETIKKFGFDEYETQLLDEGGSLFKENIIFFLEVEDDG